MLISLRFFKPYILLILVCLGALISNISAFVTLSTSADTLANLNTKKDSLAIKDQAEIPKIETSDFSTNPQKPLAPTFIKSSKRAIKKKLKGGLIFTGRGKMHWVYLGFLKGLEDYHLMPSAMLTEGYGSLLASLWKLGVPVDEMKKYFRRHSLESWEKPLFLKPSKDFSPLEIHESSLLHIQLRNESINEDELELQFFWNQSISSKVHQQWKMHNMLHWASQKQSSYTKMKNSVFDSLYEKNTVWLQYLDIEKKQFKIKEMFHAEEGIQMSLQSCLEKPLNYQIANQCNSSPLSNGYILSALPLLNKSADPGKWIHLIPGKSLLKALRDSGDSKESFLSYLPELFKNAQHPSGKGIEKETDENQVVQIPIRLVSQQKAAWNLKNPNDLFDLGYYTVIASFRCIKEAFK